MSMEPERSRALAPAARVIARDMAPLWWAIVFLCITTGMRQCVGAMNEMRVHPPTREGERRE